MNDYLIPSNTKRGGLILGWFRPVDLIIFGIGVFITLLLLISLDITTTEGAVMALLPVFTAVLLVAPVPYYHNVLVILMEAIQFITERQKFIWKGWCVADEKEDEGKK